MKLLQRYFSFVAFWVDIKLLYSFRIMYVKHVKE